MAPDFLEQFRDAFAPRYLVERQIGSGGMSIVWLAREQGEGRPVAIKVLRPELKLGDAPARFHREVEIASTLNHPNILRLYDHGSILGLPYYVMPYMPHGTLRNRMPHGTKLDIDETIQTARVIANGLEAAHAAGVLHRDIKPENILIGADGELIIADFGIGRLMDDTATRITTYGTGLGTVLYISPEQAQGRPDVDERTDVYALATIVFEMLTGETPFTGIDADAVILKKLGSPPPSVKTLRPTVTDELDRVVTKGLATAPADRYTRPEDFAAALERGQSSSPLPHGNVPTDHTLAGSNQGGTTTIKRRAIFAITMIVTTVAVYFGWTNRPGVQLKPNHYLFVQLPHADSVLGAAAGSVRYYLHDLFARVPGITIEGSIRVADRVGRIDPTFDRLVDLGRELGAAGLLIADAVVQSDTLVIGVERYDIRKGEFASFGTARLIDYSGGYNPSIPRMIEHVFALPDGTVDQPRGVAPLARLAYAEGREILENRWDLAAAADKAREALDYDEDYADAHFMLAESRAWSGAPSIDWLYHAEKALERSEELSLREGTRLAQALTFLGKRQNPQACNEYHALVQTDSSNFRAWMGLGMCQRNDNAVISDASSPTGFAYRGSYHAAREAYRTALRLVPSFNASFQGEASHRLAVILYTRPTLSRFGRHLDSSVSFLGRPELIADTIRFVPVPIPELNEPQPWFSLENHYAALDRGKRLLVEMMTTWVTAFPAVAEAHEAYAMALEEEWHISNARLALDAVRRAREVGLSTDNDVRAAATEVRLYVRSGDFESAVRVGDSLLAVAEGYEARTAVQVAGVAALLGRVNSAAEYLRFGSEFTATQPGAQRFGTTLPNIWPLRERLRIYAAFGTPRDSIQALRTQLARAVETSLDGPENRAQAMEHLLSGVKPWLVVHGLADAHGDSVSRDYVSRIQSWLVRDNPFEALAMLDEVDRVREGRRPGDVSLPQTYLEARALVAAGDSARAVARLEAALGSLGTIAFSRSPSEVAGALGYAMILMSQLAQSNGDFTTAVRWADAIRTLWRSADEDVRRAASSLLGA